MPTESEQPRVQIAEPATLSAVWQDLCVHTPERKGAPLWKHVIRLCITALISSGFHMVLLYRVGAFFHKLHLYPLSLIVEKIIYHWYHCVIPCSARIGPGLWVPHPLGIVLNSRARLGKYVWLRQYAEIVHIWEQDEGRSGIVGDRAHLNSGAILLKGGVVAEDTIIAARAVVTGYIPPRHVAMGIPAKARPMRPEELHEVRTRDPEWSTSSE